MTAATYFDGRQSIAHPVMLALENDYLNVTGDAVTRHDPIESIEIAPALGRTPRTLRFSDGASCEVTDVAALREMLAVLGRDRSLVTRLSEHAGWIVTAGLTLVFTLVVAYLYAVPAIAEAIANRMPAAAVRRVGDHALNFLDIAVFTRSEIPPDRQGKIIEAFQLLRLPPSPDNIRGRLVFRKSDALGANALALPSGVIVVTDDLVKLVSDDRQIIAVLAHESGHLAHRHSLRLLLQNSVVALALTWYVGDTSMILATAPTALLTAKYSRDFEHDADAYAAAVLRDNGLSPSDLADILERLETAHRPRRPGQPPVRDYLSTHPLTSERIAFLRGQ
jgi:Zn-dependent protease with chaperone function